MIKFKTILFLITFFSLNIFAQSIPITLHYKPIINNFTTLRLVGNFNGWNNNDDNMIMTDPDGDGVYEITLDFVVGTEYMYKFVFDANWSFAWNDPDNPDIKTSDNNNSILNVKDPFLTYLLPRGVNTLGETYIDTTIEGEPIRAIFAFSQDNPINISSLIVRIDGDLIENPSQYYNETKKEFYYQPSVPLSEGEHTILVTASSPKGSVFKISKFIRKPGLVIPKVPIDFYFDEFNTSASVIQTINSASVVGEFNNWNELFDPLSDEDDDGLWEGTAFVEEGNYEYKFKLNSSLWINDPDIPDFSETNDNNIFTAVIDSIPSIKLLSPYESTSFNSNSVELDFKALLRPGVKSKVDENSIILTVDGTQVSSNFNPDTNMVFANVLLTGEGNHYITLEFLNEDGIKAFEKYAYGINSKSSGNFFTDAIEDEQYSYPDGVADGSCDITSLLVDDVQTHDSLFFSIEMRNITDRTRIGLVISNPNSTVALDPLELEIKTDDWNNNGIFIPIGFPGNSFENNEKENRFWESYEPLKISTQKLKLNANAKESKKFEFTISLKYLDSLLGSWTREREFYCFSYLANTDKSGSSFEITENEGGSSSIEDPDVYDVAYFRSGFWQKRILKNYIPAGGKMGPRIVSLHGTGRGRLSLFAGDISDSLATYGPDISFLTPSVTYWYNNVIVKGTISDSSITSITFSFNGLETTESVANGEFNIPVTLNEGENIVFVKATDDKGFESVSKNLVLTYQKDHQPKVSISGNISDRNVTLKANAISPDSLNFTFLWSDDSNINPAKLFGTASNSEIQFSIPEITGEYYIDVKATDSKGNKAFARKLIFAKDDSVYLAENNDHAKWIDKAVVYEIYPRSFSSSGNFEGIKNKINEMVDLGINTVWFMPIYTGPTLHGYEITNYFDFEEDYGNADDFRNLVDALHNAGIRVILDFVVNHTSIQHRFMQNVLEYGENSPWADFYLWDGEPGHSNYEYYFDWGSLPNLNHQNKDVRNYFIKAALYWVQQFDIDGYRCDVAWGVEERNSDFWQEWRAALKNIKPELFLEAEASSSEDIFYQNRFDSANDWDLRNKIIGAVNGTVSINDLNTELLKPYPSYARPFRFVENHDEVRVASSHDTQRSKLMHTILMTSNGVPLIYSGGEVGEQTNRGIIDWSDSDNIKPYFKRIIDIHNKYVENPILRRVANSSPNKVYTYTSISNEHTLLTYANLSNSQLAGELSITRADLPNDSTAMYLTNLLNGNVIEINPTNISVTLDTLFGFEATVYYYGKEPITVDVERNNDLIIEDYLLNQNFPNPFNPETKISFQIPKESFVSIKVFDVLGRNVATLVESKMAKGRYTVLFNGSNLSSGIYFYSMKAGDFYSTKKLLLLK